MPMTPDEVVKVLENLEPSIMHSTMCNLWHDLGGVVRNRDRAGFTWECNCELGKKREALTTATSLIQDYQKLRERIKGDELGLKIFIKLSGLPYEQATDFWTSKHCQNSIKKVSAELAEETIPSYLL